MAVPIAASRPTTSTGVQSDRFGRPVDQLGPRPLLVRSAIPGSRAMFTEAEGLRGIAFSRGACGGAPDGTLVLRRADRRDSRLPRARTQRERAAASRGDRRARGRDTARRRQLGTMDRAEPAVARQVDSASRSPRSTTEPREANQFAYRLEAFETKVATAPARMPPRSTRTSTPATTCCACARRTARACGPRTGSSLPIHIRPPWWETLVFRFGLFLLITTDHRDDRGRARRDAEARPARAGPHRRRANGAARRGQSTARAAGAHRRPDGAYQLPIVHRDARGRMGA